MLQISLLELHNDMILPIPQGGFPGAINQDGNLCIGYTYIIKYNAKHIKQTINVNNITCGFETCISSMSLQSDLNKWRL